MCIIPFSSRQVVLGNEWKSKSRQEEVPCSVLEGNGSLLLLFFSLFVIAYLSVLSKTSTPVILSVKLSSIPFYASHLVFPFSQIFPAGRSNSTDPIVQQTAVIQKLYQCRYHRINHYSADKCWGNRLRYPMDVDLSDG